MPQYRSVKDDVEGFCGWSFLLDLVNEADTLLMKGLIATLFETGGRISEVLSLRKWNFETELNPEVVVVKQMPLLKRFEKVGTVKKWKCVKHCDIRWTTKPRPEEYEKHNIKEYEGWLTKPVRDQRTIPIRVSEPLTEHLMNWLDEVKQGSDRLFPLHRSAAFVQVRAVGRRLDEDIPLCNIRSPLLYDHWFRSERACQLAFDYGFNRDDMNEFFQWKERRPSMAERYSSLGWIGLARKMGVKI